MADTIDVINAAGATVTVATPDAIKAVNEAIRDRIGPTNSAAPAAGGDGDVSGKLKRMTVDLDAVKTAVAAIQTAIGAVDPSPTANTLQDRLKSLSAFTDGLETLVTATNTALTTLNGYADGLEALIGSTNTALATTNSAIGTTNTTLSTVTGYVDGLETLIGATNTAIAATNTALSALSGYVDGLEGGIGAAGDAAVTNPAASASAVAALKGVLSLLSAGATAANQATANSSLSSIASALSGAATATKQDAQTTLLGTIDSKLGDLKTYTDGLETLMAAPAAAGEQHVGAVGGHATTVDVTLSLDTSAYASGDVLADTQVITNLMRVNDGTGILNSLVVIDKDDQKQEIDFYFLDANVSMGTENSAPSISDANAANILGKMTIAAADYDDLGGVSVGMAGFDTGRGPFNLKPASGTRNVYLAAVLRSGTPTYTASGIVCRVGVSND